jgi:phosphoglycerate dehydrogenase-like enzyme
MDIHNDPRESSCGAAADPVINLTVWTDVGQREVLEELASLTEVTVKVAISAADFLTSLPEAEVVVMMGTATAYSPEVARRMCESPTLRWIHLMSAGYEGVVQNGRPGRCHLTGPGEGVSTAVAEHALALLWALARGLPDAVRQQSHQLWERGFAAGTTTLAGKTLLVVGFGTIGRKIGALGRAIGMHVIGVSRSGLAHDSAHEVHPASSLIDLLPRADAIIAALPLNASTSGLFDQHTFEYCRPGAFFVNVGRGATVDGRALVRALSERTLRAAALDVTTPEPLPAGDAMWSAERLLLTPHVGGAGDRDAIRAIARQLVANVRRFQRGEPLVNLIHIHPDSE